jgi:predicted glycoside hydrolase/deacetylase ChbG (UPF0249 family)
VRRLIVNADDFGMTRGINRAIVEACTRGVVTSTTLMATARGFQDAVAVAPQLGVGVSVGCHLIFLDGEPVLPAARISSLLQPQSASNTPEFRIKLNDFSRAAVAGKLSSAELQAEAGAQIQRLHDAGIPPSHVDCHKHAHMFPAVLTAVLRAAQAADVKAIRNPFGRLVPLPFSRILRNPKIWRRIGELGVLRSFAANFRKQVAAFGLRTTDGSVGVLDTGSLDLESFLLIVDGLPEGTWEFVCHPGYNDAELDHVRTRLRLSRETELAVLTSPDARQALERRGIQLISYRDV